jgi:putative ABC transport system permease protein
MKFIDYLRIAFRNISRQKLRSALTIFAVVIGATSVTIMLALVTGAKSFFLQQVESNGMLQQVAVSSKQDIADFEDANHGNNNCDNCVKLTDELMQKIQKIPHVTGVARLLYGYNIHGIEYNGKKYSLDNVKASDANGIITTTVLAGRDLKETDTEGVITVTADYADKFGYKNNYQALIGKEVNLITQTGYSGVGAEIPKPNPNPKPGDMSNDISKMPATLLKAKIVGVTDTSSDSKAVRIPLEWAKGMNVNRMWQVTAADAKLNEAACRNTRGPCSSQQHMTLVTYDYMKDTGYPSFIVKADSSKNAKQVARDIKKLGVGAADAESMIKAQTMIFDVIGLILGGIGGIALVVAAIGVINTMIMSILERTREIGVMRAVGARRSTVRRLFTFEASLLGFIGGVLGVGVGYGLTRIANVVVNKQLADQSVKAHDIIGMPLWLVLAVIGIATLIGFLAGLYPAARAAKMDPVEALRYE